MYKVLIVDDEEIICEGLSLLVDWKALGFIIGGCASNGQEALSRAVDGDYDLIITDIRMPVLDGLDFIQKLKEACPMIQILIISGYNEFSYAKKAISLGVKGFLLKPIDRYELTELLLAVKEVLDDRLSTIARESSVHDILRNRFLYDLVNGNLMESEIESGRSSGWVSLHCANYVSALLEISDFRRMVEESLAKAKNVRNQVKGIAMLSVNNRKCGTVYEEDSGLLGILFYGCSTALSMAQITECLKEIVDTVQARLGINVSMAFGESVAGVALLQRSRAQAEESLNRMLFIEGKGVADVAMFTSGQQAWNVQWSRTALIQAIEENNKAAIDREILELVREMTDISSPVGLAYTLLNTIILDISKIIKNKNGNIEMLIDQKSISRIKSLGDMEALLADICEKASTYVKELSVKARPKLIDQVTGYIDAHYMEDITLKSVSQNFFMNTAYLGQLFKASTNESFNSYLNMRRISEAKKLLLANDLRISEIIEKVGYKNTQHFYKQFKKAAGISVQTFKNH